VKKVKCFNYKKIGHFVRDCYAKGGRAKGKGPKKKGQEKGKEKESAAKVEEKNSEDDGVWMMSVGVMNFSSFLLDQHMFHIC
jgi:hypothetical protein